MDKKTNVEKDGDVMMGLSSDVAEILRPKFGASRNKMNPSSDALLWWLKSESTNKKPTVDSDPLAVAGIEKTLSNVSTSLRCLGTADFGDRKYFTTAGLKSCVVSAFKSAHGHNLGIKSHVHTGKSTIPLVIRNAKYIVVFEPQFVSPVDVFGHSNTRLRISNREQLHRHLTFLSKRTERELLRLPMIDRETNTSTTVEKYLNSRLAASVKLVSDYFSLHGVKICVHDQQMTAVAVVAVGKRLIFKIQPVALSTLKGHEPHKATASPSVSFAKQPFWQ